MSNSNLVPRFLRYQDANIARHADIVEQAIEDASGAIKTQEEGQTLSQEEKHLLYAVRAKAVTMVKGYYSYVPDDKIMFAVGKLIRKPGSTANGWTKDPADGIYAPDKRTTNKILFFCKLIYMCDKNPDFAIKQFPIDLNIKSVDAAIRNLEKKEPTKACKSIAVYDAIVDLIIKLAEHHPYSTGVEKVNNALDAVLKTIALLTHLKENVVSQMFSGGGTDLINVQHRFEEYTDDSKDHGFLLNAEALAILQLAEKHSQAMPH